MFIKQLKISAGESIIREMNFTNGMNLIIDDTPTDDKQLTGNNVGKTTVLKLIYFCLGGNEKDVYTDEENKKAVYSIVKDYLIDSEVLITLVLVGDINDEKSKQIIIERNFLSGTRAVRKINGQKILKKTYEDKLASSIFPKYSIQKPSFKQIISHNIRYKDDSINKTLKTLSRYTTDIEYETLYLYLLGCGFCDGKKKQDISAQIVKEHEYKQRLEKCQNKNFYEISSVCT